MAPTNPSASKKKQGTSGETKKKKKNEASDRDRRAKDEEEKTERLANEFLATSLGRSLGITDERIAAAGGFQSPTSPDNPPCDGCQKPFAGTMQCGRCESVFYCGRDCQLSHWSAGGHKTECKKLKKENEKTATRVLTQFKDVDRWTDLDIAGAYKAAVHQGLHDKIREVMELDKAEFVDKYQNPSRGGDCTCYTQWVMSVLFRGQRAEGKAEEYHSAFDCVDGPRIKNYVRSHPNALDAWLQASVELVRAVVGTGRATMMRQPFLHRSVHVAARDVWSGWSLVLTSSTAARAILSPFPSKTTGGGGGDEEEEESAEQRRARGEEHVRGIAKAMAEAFRLVRGASDPNLDPGSAIEGNLNTVAAMFHLRAQEYKVGVDVEAVLNLKGTAKKMFQHMAIPMAKKTIEKGAMLNSQEANAVMAVASRGMGLR